jgi:O-antigen ligase
MIRVAIINNLLEKLDFSQRSLREKLLFFDLLAFFFFLPISVTGVQVTLAIGLVLIYPDVAARPRELFGKPFILPLALFLLLSLTAVLMSAEPINSLEAAKNLLLVLVIPLVIYGSRSYEELKLQIGAMTVSGLLSALLGIYQVSTGSGGGTEGYRLTGSMGHYMTAGGIFMILAILLIAVSVFVVAGRSRLVTSSVAALAVLAVLLTQSRNAYVGLAMALVALSMVWKRQIIFFLPFVLSLAVLLSPPMVRERMFRLVDLQDASVQTRISMMETGLRMMSDFPLFGIGLGEVEEFYNHYKAPAAPGDVPHLHNNVLQIAAERGIPALVCWLWLIYSFGKQLFLISQDMSRQRWRRGMAGGAFAVIVALFFAGMFEYNFGDTEVQIMFWAVICLPMSAFSQRERAENES